MTDRYEGFVVTLETPKRDDDSEATLKAIQQIKGVLSVDPIISTGDHWTAAFRAKTDLLQKLQDFIRDNYK